MKILDFLNKKNNDNYNYVIFQDGILYFNENKNNENLKNNKIYEIEQLDSLVDKKIFF